MKRLKTEIASIILLLGVSFHTAAQESTERTKWSVEIDPVTFVFKGYSAHLRIQPKGCEHLLVGLGTYAMNMPDALVSMNSKNKDKGWNVRLNQGYSLFGEYHFSQVNRKWFIGTQLGVQEFKIEQREVAGSEKFSNFLAMGYFGYTWKPFQKNLYIKPWAGMGYVSNISGSTRIGTTEYDIAPITMFATLHVGYTF